MTTITKSSTSLKGVSKIALISSVIFTLFLFYIDEGYYNFNWMADLGNWVAFIIYVAVLFLVQFAVFHFVNSMLNIAGASLDKSALYSIMILIGLGLGLFLCFLFFS